MKKYNGQLHSNPMAPLLHNKGWGPALGSPDPMHAEPWGELVKKKKVKYMEHCH